MIRLFVLALWACAAFAQEKNPVQWKLNAPAKAAAGAPVKVTLAAKISAAWHLYSLKELEGGPIPTRISVPEGQPFRLTGEIEAPPPIRKQDEAFGMEVESYEDSAQFGLPLTAAAEAGAKTLTVTVRYQVCDDKLCLPPRTVKLEAPVEITK